jgi:predicted DNA-binding transcriptional regulator AlpA
VALAVERQKAACTIQLRVVPNRSKEVKNLTFVRGCVPHSIGRKQATVTALETPMALNAMVQQMPLREPLLTVEDVAQRLNVTKDWVWDHSSRKAPYLPVIRMSDGVLRYRLSEVEEFVNERERLSSLRRKRR